MDGWWADIEGEIHECLERYGAMTPAQIGHALGMSAPAAASLLSMLAAEGKVTISLVEPPARDDGRQLSLLARASAA